MVKMMPKEKGVTLIESMIALLVFLLGSVGWMAVETNLAKSSGESQLVAKALFIAESKIDALRQIPFDQLTTSEEADHFDLDGQPVVDGSFYDVTWTVTAVPDITPAQSQVDVQVSWNFQAEFQNAIVLSFVRSE